MCGICGIIYKKSSDKVLASVLEKMNNAMTHRGPDNAGHYIKDNVGIAMRRLSIIDLQSGHQPLSNEDNSIQIVLNGEIYNYLELREDLETKGHKFRTNSDAEVLPHLYEEYGSEFTSKLNGMFGFAIWDENTKTLILGRDRMGQKPLYFSKQNDTFIFGSELKVLLAYPEIKKEIDKKALSKYLAYEYIPAPQTIFKNIYKLEPGHILIYHKGNFSQKKYWKIPTEEFEDITINQAAETLNDLLFQSVKRRLMSDVPLGVFLSGGIDSSTITGLMTKIMPSDQVKSFSIAFAEKSFDESTYARLIASKFATDHREDTCSAESLIKLLPEVQNFLCEPLGDTSIIPTYALSKFTRQHVTVALGGDGGDELFAGYPTFQAEKFSRIYRAIPGFIRNLAIEPLIRRLPVNDNNISFDFKAKQFVKAAGLNDVARHFIWIGSFAPDEQKRLLNTDTTANLFEDVERHWKDSEKASFYNRILYLYKKLYLNEDILVKVDRASMACSLEVRAPFLDYHVVEFASRLPYSFKLHGLNMKYILKKAVTNLLPNVIANRPKKGFGVPVAKWIKGPLKEMTYDLLSKSKIKSEGLFDPMEVETLLEDHIKGKFDNRKKLWTLMAFELWYDRWAK